MGLNEADQLLGTTQIPKLMSKGSKVMSTRNFSNMRGSLEYVIDMYLCSTFLSALIYYYILLHLLSNYIGMNKIRTILYI
jgi:hypothetical protein